MSPRAFVEGLSARRYPARFAGGLGAAGVQSLRDFVDGGGTLVALNDACDFVISALDLPVTNAVRRFRRGSSMCRAASCASPSIPRSLSPRDSPRSRSPGSTGPGFEVGDPTRVRVIARYPAARRHPALGMDDRGANIAGKAALLEVRHGRGRVVLFGFQPQYRGQSSRRSRFCSTRCGPLRADGS